MKTSPFDCVCVRVHRVRSEVCLSRGKKGNKKKQFRQNNCCYGLGAPEYTVRTLPLPASDTKQKAVHNEDRPGSPLATFRTIKNPRNEDQIRWGFRLCQPPTQRRNFRNKAPTNRELCLCQPHNKVKISEKKPTRPLPASQQETVGRSGATVGVRERRVHCQVVSDRCDNAPIPLKQDADPKRGTTELTRTRTSRTKPTNIDLVSSEVIPKTSKQKRS